MSSRNYCFCLRPALSKNGQLYGDLNGFRASDNPPTTIPIDILATSSRPDIVFVSNDKTNITIIELTIPFNSPDSFAEAQYRKYNKYQLLLSELETKGLKPKFLSVEIGALGHWQSKTGTLLHKLVPVIPKPDIRSMLDDAGKIAITASYHIFKARREKSWSSPPFITS